MDGLEIVEATVLALYINTVKHGWNGLKSEPAIFEKLIGNCELCSRKHLAV